MKKLIKIDLKQKIALLAGVVLLFLLCRPMSQLTAYENIARYAMDREYLIMAMEAFFLPGVFTDMFPTLLVSVLIGIVFFSYLFSKTRVDLYHSIPVNRKRLFITNYVSGVIVYLIALFAEYFIGMLIAIPNHYMTGTAFKNMFIGMGINFAEFLFGYSITIFTVMITGKLVVCVTGILTIFLFFPITASLLYYFASYFYATYMEFDAIKPDVMTTCSYLSPVTSYAHILSKNVDGYNYIDYGYNGTSATFMDVLAPFIVAVIISALAYYLYQKRPSEAAGKAIAFKIAQPIIRIPITILGGFLGTWFMLSSVNGFKTKWLWFGLLLGVVLTHCILEIIFRESFKALFEDKMQLAACIVATVAIIGVFFFDITGFDTYVPNKDKVEGVAVYFQGIDSGVSGAELKADPENPGCFISTYYISEKKPFENPGTSEEFINKVFELSKIGVANVDSMIQARYDYSDDGIYYAGAYEEKAYATEEAMYFDDNPMSGLKMTGEENISSDEAYSQAKEWMDEMGIIELERKHTSRKINIEIMYKLKGGKIIFRRYDVPVADVLTAMNDVYTSEEYNKTHFDLYEAAELDAIHKVEVYDAFENKVCLITEEDAKEFLNAYIKDLSKIDIDTISGLPIGRVSPQYKGSYGYEETYSGYYLYPQFKNTLAYLEGIGCNMSGFTTEVKAKDIQSISINSYNQYGYESGESVYTDELIYTKDNNPEMIKLLAPKFRNINNIWSNEILINSSEEGPGIDITVAFTSVNGIQRVVSVKFENDEIPDQVMKDIAVKIWQDQRY